MVFWGTVINKSKPYIHSRHDYSGRLRITQATLGLPSKSQSTAEKVIVLCKQGNKIQIPLCILIPDTVECQKLELELEASEEFEISVIGNQSVSLSGYYISCYNGITSMEDDKDSNAEDIAETNESSEHDSDDDANESSEHDSDDDANESSEHDSGDDDFEVSESFTNDSSCRKLNASSKPKYTRKAAERSIQLTPKFPDF